MSSTALQETNDDLARKLGEARLRIKELEEALWPFALEFPERFRDKDGGWLTVKNERACLMLIGDFRKAHALVRAKARAGATP